MTSPLTWCDIDDGALPANVKSLRQALGQKTLLGTVVKGDAYGHGLLDSARAFVDAGADWLAVHSPAEAEALRDGGVEAPVLVCGPTQAEQAASVAASGARVIAYDGDVVGALAAAGHMVGVPIRLHLKIEMGTHRQGVGIDDVVDFARYVQGLEGVQLEGTCTHFADVEDGEDHAFARYQLGELEQARELLAAASIDIELWHAASSAAALVLPESRLDLVRVGIAAYGHWPSDTIEHLPRVACAGPGSCVHEPEHGGCCRHRNGYGNTSTGGGNSYASGHGWRGCHRRQSVL
jgi:alanine racemase